MTTTDGYDAGYDEDVTDEHTGADRHTGADTGAYHEGAGQLPAGTTEGGTQRRITPDDLHHVRFNRGTLVHPGYADAEVDGFLSRVADELARLTAEKSELRDQVHALQEQISGTTAPEPPSDQAVRILTIAQQTADNYVAEAESFSRTATQSAREQYEEQLRRARENAGAIIQAAQEAAESIAGGGGPAGGRPVAELPEEELQEQIRYLKAFAQAVRVQLRAYLEALLTDVETEWGQADPSAVVQTPLRTPAQRSDRGSKAARLHTDHEPNVADVLPAQEPTQEPRGSGSAEIAGARR
jgi:DivIVA domain-containing protein